MKKIALASATLALALSAGSAFAANSLVKGTFGVNVPFQNDQADNFMINGKYFVGNDLAVLAGLGVRVAGGDAKGTDIGVSGGIRKYLKTDDFAPFVGGRVIYTSTNDSNTKDLSVMAEAGAEYFLSRQFSIEGRVGFGYTSNEVQTSTTIIVGGVPFTSTSTAKTTYIGTGTLGLSANFYF